ncbi:MAG: sulfatase-like hydrolase/transferase [Limisphaerales bacterium]
MKLLRLILGLCTMVALSSVAETPKPKRPNVLLIMADDLGAECLGSYGGQSYSTPNLDKMAAEGMRFATAYSTPLCSPTRVQLMTGRYGFRTGWTNLIGRGATGTRLDYFDPNKEITFGHLLKKAGYATALAGKWQLARFPDHPDHVKQSGFDTYSCWMWVEDPTGNKATLRYWNPVIWQEGKRLEKEIADKYGEDVFTEFLINFMKENKNKPFFAYYPMLLTHSPFVPTPDSKESDPKTVRQSPKYFGDMVAYTDKTVGRLLAALDELGIRENTVIIFTGDNGTPKEITSRAYGLEIPGGKGTVSHVGSHVPFIVQWKGVTPAGKVVNDPIDLSDVFPTLAELAQTELPKDRKIDGHSFAPQLRGKEGSPRQWIFSQLQGQRLVRDKRYTLHSDGRMFDVKKDPLEKKDLSQSVDPKIAKARKQLQGALAELR